MIETPFNYTGSKFKLLEQILPEFDYTKPYFVDLFTGGGSVYTNVLDKYEKVIANDIIKDLIGIHQELLNSDNIIDLTKKTCPNKTDDVAFSKLRDDYNLNPTPDKLWALMLSCTSNMMRFNQKFKFNQTFGKRSWNSSTQNKVDLFTKHIRQYKDKIRFSSKPFNELGLSKNTFYYIDPPYGYIKDKNGDIGNKQISEAGYNSFYYKQDDINLYNLCNEINKNGSTFVLSGVLEHGDKTSWILDKLIQDGFKYKELNFNYNKVSKKGDKVTTEVIIMNYDISK
jgi:DNA adenine methylase Dam